MNRSRFMARLGRGLRGAPPAFAAEVVGDYDNYFAEGLASGRSEAELVEALGDPRRLAAELQLTAGLGRWRREPSTGAAAKLALAALALGLADLALAFPLALALLVCAAGPLVSLGALVWGGFIVLATLIDRTGAASLLVGVGLIAAAVAGGAISALALRGFVGLAAWFARLHGRAMAPVVSSSRTEPA